MKNLRTYDILAYLRKKKRCTLAELMKKFDVSSATIHRDVQELVSTKAVERVRGGLVFADAPSARPGGFTYADRAVANLSDKEAIAHKALKLVTDGDILFLDSSTTVHTLAQLLRSQPFEHLTIVTNSVSILQEFSSYPAKWTLIGLGGTYDPQLNAILGEEAMRQLDGFNITKAFISAFGVDAKTATTNCERQVGIIRKALDAAQRRYLLVDRTKFNRTGVYRLSSRGAFDAIVTFSITTGSRGTSEK